MSDVREFLASVPLFARMSELELNAVSAFLERRRYAAGDTIFLQGDEGKEFFIVRSGLVVSTVEESDGSLRELYAFCPGQSFGEMAVIEGAPRSATCKAIEESELLVMDGLDFHGIVWNYPMIGVKMLAAMVRVMTGWLSEASGFLNDLVRWGQSARKRAVTDDLSGLFNRRFLEEIVRGRFQIASEARPCAILMMDLDRFRVLNERYGTEAGDSVISTASTAIARGIRDGDVAARLSGDEFAVFLPDSSAEEALSVAERVRTELAELYLEFRRGKQAVPERVKVTVSIGVAAFPVHAIDAATLFQAADAALFRAKESGRDRVWEAPVTNGK